MLPPPPPLVLFAPSLLTDSTPTPPQPIATGCSRSSQSERGRGAGRGTSRGKQTGRSSVFSRETQTAQLLSEAVCFHSEVHGSVSDSPLLGTVWFCFWFCFSMSGFDDPGVYYSDSFGGGGEGPGGDEGGLKRSQIKKRFREFLRQFRVGTDRTGFTYKYR